MVVSSPLSNWNVCYLVAAAMDEWDADELSLNKPMNSCEFLLELFHFVGEMRFIRLSMDLKKKQRQIPPSFRT